MASKTTGRLAGLAALGAAAYLYNKDKTKDPVKGDSKAVTEKPRTFADVEADEDAGMGKAMRDNIAAAQKKEKPEEAAVDSGDFLSRRLNRLDADDGKLYSTNNLSPMSSPASTTRVQKKPLASAPAAKPVAVKAPTLEDEYAAQEKLMSAYKPRRPDTKLKDAKFTTKSGNKTLTMTPYAGEEMKRGGKVKKMASGGMTSKRGDGIASKGRTRCKMY